MLKYQDILLTMGRLFGIRGHHEINAGLLRNKHIVNPMPEVSNQRT